MEEISIEIQIELPENSKSLVHEIQNAVSKTIEVVSPALIDYSLSLLICDDSVMKMLNNTYRGIEQSTDVLSFSADYTLPESNTTYLGDIAISYPTARKQATLGNYPVNQEIMLLSVHGVLHLLGYDHLSDNDKEVMWNFQKKIMTLLGYEDFSLPGE